MIVVQQKAIKRSPLYMDCVFFCLNYLRTLFIRCLLSYTVVIGLARIFHVSADSIIEGPRVVPQPTIERVLEEIRN